MVGRLSNLYRHRTLSSCCSLADSLISPSCMRFNVDQAVVYRGVRRAIQCSLEAFESPLLGIKDLG